MGLAIPIETSARHIHLCREDFEILFGEGKELTFKSELSQPGQFACEERLEVRGPKGAFVITQSFERALIFADVIVRVSPQFALAMHVDTDEANAFAGTENPTGTLLKLFGGKSEELQRWADEIQSGIHRI